MSQSKRRSRKSKLVPRFTEGGEPEIEEVMESEEEEEERPIKIMKTATASQPEPSKSNGSIQFKVDIEVEEWIDDEIFIEENFNKMQSEKLSKALDKEISEEVDWTNAEYGKIWAEAASDSEHEEKPLNEYEKIIKNQVDPSVLAGTSKDRPESSKDNGNKPGPSKDNRKKPGPSKDNWNRPDPSKDNRNEPGPSKDNGNRPGTSNEAKTTSKGNKKQKMLDGSEKGPSRSLLKVPPKPYKTKKVLNAPKSIIGSDMKVDVIPTLKPIPPGLKIAIIPPPNTGFTQALKPIRQYKRPGPKSKTMETSPSAKSSLETSSSGNTSTETSTSEKSLLKTSAGGNTSMETSSRGKTATKTSTSEKSLLKTSAGGNTSMETSSRGKTATKTSTSERSLLKTSTGENTSMETSSGGKSLTFKVPNKNCNLDDDEAPKMKINIVYSDKAPISYHIDLSDQAPKDKINISYSDEAPISYHIDLSDQTTTQEIKFRKRKFMISELDEFAKTHNQSVSEPYDPTTMVPLKQIITTEAAILGESKRIALFSNDPIDHYLDIELRNRMGNTRFIPNEMSREEALIDFGLREWYTWLGKHKVRSPPLTYKCYICNEAWWYLYPFQVHLKKHQVVNVTIEKQGQECNLIAHNSNKVGFKSIPPYGGCLRCGREYFFHFPRGAYTCTGCRSTLFTCKALAEHEGICLVVWKQQMELQKTKDVKAYKCKICPQVFFTDELLHNHQYRAHVPRSDHPIWAKTLQCNFCHQNYVDYAFHYCNRRVQKLKCRYCSTHFPSNKAYQMHMNMVKKRVTCTYCKEGISKGCMLARHLLVHNKNYIMVYKCLMCVGKNILLGDVTMVTRHAEFVHKTNKYVTSLWCYASVLLPKSFNLNKITTMHAPTAMHEQLKESFVKDQFRDMEESDDSWEENESHDSLEEKECNVNVFLLKKLEDSSEEKDLQDSTDLQDSQNFQNSSEPQDPPTIKIENVVSNYVEEETTNMDSIEANPEIDITKIKVEIDENIEGTEVDPADLINTTETLLDVVKKEEPEDDNEIDTSESFKIIDISLSSIQDIDTSKVKIEADTFNVHNKEFCDKLREYLNNREEDEDLEFKEIKDNIHICLTCDFEGTKKQFKEHLTNCDSGEMAKKKQDLTCTKCKKHFGSMKDYVKHLPKHGFAWCKCTECDRTFPHINSWVHHIGMHIRRSFIVIRLLADAKVYRCRVCKEFVDRKLFFKHWEGHLELPFMKVVQAPVETEVEGGMSAQLLNRIEEIFLRTKSSMIPPECIICDKSFCRMNEKKRHLVEHLLEAACSQTAAHGGLVCQFCGVKVQKADEFRQHMRDHAGLAGYHCEVCNKAFSDSSNFVKHKKFHDMDTYTCDECNKKFLSKASLETHIATHWPDPLHCEHCPSKLFYNESSYNRHLRVKHAFNSSNKQFKCQHCWERFPTHREKANHQWEKHQIRTQKADCPLCDMKFRKVSELRTHIYDDHHVKQVFNYRPIEKRLERTFKKVKTGTSS